MKLKRLLNHNMMKKYLDSNVFIYPLLYDDEKAKLCENILRKIINGEIKAYTSILTWDEIVYVLWKKKGTEISKNEGYRFLRFPNLNFIDVNTKILFKSQLLMEKYNLKPRDSIHAACAIIFNIQDIISDDSDFDNINELHRDKLV